MGRFRYENVLSLLSGIQAGKQQRQMQMRQEAEQQKQQALSLIPHLLQAEQQRRSAALSPYETALQTEGLTDDSRRSLTEALLGAQRAYPVQDGQSMYSGVMSGNKNLQFGGGPTGAMPAMPQIALRDRMAEARAEEERRRGLAIQDRTDDRAYQDKRDDTRDAALAKRNKDQAILNSKTGLVEKFYGGMYPQVRERGFDPKYDYGILEGAPEQVQGHFRIPGAFGQREPFNFRRPSAFGGGNPGPTDDQLKDEARGRLEQGKAAARKELAELKADATKFKTKSDFVKHAGDLWQRGGQDLSFLSAFQQQKAAEWDAMEQGKPAPQGKAIPTTMTPQQAQVKKTQADTSYLGKRIAAFDQEQQDKHENYASMKGYRAHMATVASRNATSNEMRAAKSGTGGGGVRGSAGSGVPKWLPAHTKQVDIPFQQWKSKQALVGERLSEMLKQEQERRKASGTGTDPLGGDFANLNPGKVAALIESGAIAPTYKLNGKTVKNPLFNSFVTIRDLQKEADEALIVAQGKADSLAKQFTGGAASAATSGGFSEALKPLRQKHIALYTKTHGKPDAAKINELSRAVEQGLLK